MNTPDTPMSALPEDDGKLVERLRGHAATMQLADMPTPAATNLEAATRIETLSREIERVRELEDAVALYMMALKAKDDGHWTDRYCAARDKLREVWNVYCEATMFRSLTTGSGAGEDTKGNE